MWIYQKGLNGRSRAKLNSVRKMNGRFCEILLAEHSKEQVHGE